MVDVRRGRRGRRVLGTAAALAATVAVVSGCTASSGSSSASSGAGGVSPGSTNGVPIRVDSRITLPISAGVTVGRNLSGGDRIEHQVLFAVQQSLRAQLHAEAGSGASDPLLSAYWAQDGLSAVRSEVQKALGKHHEVSNIGTLVISFVSYSAPKANGQAVVAYCVDWQPGGTHGQSAVGGKSGTVGGGGASGGGNSAAGKTGAGVSSTGRGAGSAGGGAGSSAGTGGTERSAVVGGPGGTLGSPSAAPTASDAAGQADAEPDALAMVVVTVEELPAAVTTGPVAETAGTETSTTASAVTTAATTRTVTTKSTAAAATATQPRTAEKAGTFTTVVLKRNGLGEWVVISIAQAPQSPRCTESAIAADDTTSGSGAKTSATKTSGPAGGTGR